MMTYKTLNAAQRQIQLGSKDHNSDFAMTWILIRSKFWCGVVSGKVTSDGSSIFI